MVTGRGFRSRRGQAELGDFDGNALGVSTGVGNSSPPESRFDGIAVGNDRFTCPEGPSPRIATARLSPCSPPSGLLVGGPASRMRPNPAIQADTGSSQCLVFRPDGDDPYDVPLVNKAMLDRKFHPPARGLSGPRKRRGTIVVRLCDIRFPHISSRSGGARPCVTANRRRPQLASTLARRCPHRKRTGVWPNWSPTDNMRRIDPSLPVHMEGGIENPLGARALYLYQGSRDTLFRIHGTNEPWSIGEAVSSGCVRLLNEDIVDLYNRVQVGARVTVRRGGLGA